MKKVDLRINGSIVPLIFEHNSALPIVSLRLIFKASGALFAKKHGLAKISAGLLNEGTKKLGENEFNKRLEMNAVSMGATANFETFSIEISCLKEHFSMAFTMLEELLGDPNYTDETLENIKIKTSGIIASLKSDFDYQAKIKLNKLLFPNSNLAQPLIGTKDSLEDISLEDISKFLNSHLDISNLFIVLGGDVDFEDLNFKGLLSYTSVGKPRKIELIKSSNECKVETSIKNTEQAYIYFGSPYNISKDERYLANVATFILGSSGFGSRLMEEIRVKRGLAYSAYAKNELNLSYSIISGYLQTKNENKDEAINLVKDEISKFIQHGVSQNELDGAKNFLLGNEPLLKETLSKRLSTATSEYYFGYELGEFDRNLEKIRALQLEELNEFIISHKEIADQSFSIIYNNV